MSDPIRIWLEIVHHMNFRTGGWAFVRRGAGEANGTAGGERNIDLERTMLSAFAAALEGLPQGAGVELHTTSPLVLGIPARIAAAERGETPPGENLDLWAQAATALRRLKVVVRRGENERGSPSAFAAAWADLAHTRAKDKGAFAAAIPKPNLAKAGV